MNICENLTEIFNFSFSHPFDEENFDIDNKDDIYNEIVNSCNII